MGLVQPHGSRKVLTPALVTGARAEEEKKRAARLPGVQVSPKEAGDILMLGMGAFSPLTGFMGREDYQGVVEEMRLRKTDPGTLWPLPVTLAVREVTFQQGEEVALHDGQEIIATMLVEDIYEPDKKKECESSFMGGGTRDAEEFWSIAEEEHPGVRQVLEAGPHYVGGPLKVLSERNLRQLYGQAYMTPAVSRQIFEERGWSTVAAFQTRTPIHRAQEYLCKVAQELLDGLFIHALVGRLQPGEVPAEVRMRCYRTLIDHYFNQERTVLAVYPMDMRYAGPKEALLHAIFRQNFGCSHLLVGRDHAGVGDFYSLFEAQEIFDTLWPGALAVQPLKFDWTFWSYKNNGMASLKTAPTDDPADRVVISGTKLRRLMAEGRLADIPPEYSRPEVLHVLAEYYASVRA